MEGLPGRQQLSHGSAEYELIRLAHIGSVQFQHHRSAFGLHRWLWVLWRSRLIQRETHAKKHPASHLPEVPQADAILAP